MEQKGENIMTVDLNNLFRLTKAQIKPAAEMLTRAFQDNPGLVYYFPDESERKNKSHHLHQFMLCYGLIYGEVYATSPNLEGLAVWLPSENVNMSLWRVIRSGGLSMIYKLGSKAASQVRPFGDYVSSIHKRHAPFRHWYLLGLGVDPDYQGQGYASTLLKAMFTRIDKERLPCYLETQNPNNVPIYQHYGFKVVEESIVPNTKVTNWAMLREKVG
jgi:ribosomal protein S18 acetylase RimI-like enzyme